MLEYFATVGGMVILSTAVGQGIIKVFKIDGKAAKQIVSWAAPIIACIAGLICQVGLFAVFGPISSFAAWVYTIVTGVGVGLASNGIYDLKNVIKAINAILPDGKKVPEEDGASDEVGNESAN